MDGISVIDEAGIVVASVGFDGLKGDGALFGGFLSAIQVFVKMMASDEIRELRFGEVKMLIGSVGTYRVVTLHKTSEKDAESKNRAVQELIEKRGAQVDDGLLSLVISMIEFGEEGAKESQTEASQLSESERKKMRERAKGWRKK